MSSDAIHHGTQPIPFSGVPEGGSKEGPAHQFKASAGEEQLQTRDEKGESRVDRLKPREQQATASAAPASESSWPHSQPLPWSSHEWTADAGIPQSFVVDALGENVLYGRGKRPNADRIVACINAYDALVAQRDEMLEALKGCLDTSESYTVTLHRVRTVLAKAGA